MLYECFRALPVIKRIVGVKPVAFWVHFEVRDFCDVVVFDQKLPFGYQCRNEVNFFFVEMKLIAIQITVHIGVGQKDFSRARLNDHINDVGLPQFIERLRGKNHCCILFPPGLERFNDVRAYPRVLEEDPRLIDQERFEDMRNVSIGDDLIGSMEDIEEKWLENLRVLLHALKIKTLEP